MLYIRAIIPAFPLALYILVSIQAYRPILGILVGWLGLVSGMFTAYLIYKRLMSAERVQRIEQRTTVQRLVSFIGRQRLIPLFILLCSSFTSDALINFVANLSHIRPKYYFIVLASSRLVSIITLGYLGKGTTTTLARPLRGILVLVMSVIFWIVGKKLKQHSMGSKEE